MKLVPHAACPGIAVPVGVAHPLITTVQSWCDITYTIVTVTPGFNWSKEREEVILLHYTPMWVYIINMMSRLDLCSFTFYGECY